MNNWNAIGRLTKDVELRYTPSGVAVASFTIAVDRQFTNAQGEREADFVNCVAWRQLAELCANHLSKGSEIGVTASIQSGSYTNQEGKKVYTTNAVLENVKFLRKPGGTGTTNNNSVRDPFANDSRTIDISDDDIPF